MILRKQRGFENMVYKIYYRKKDDVRPRRVLFDIEIYLVQDDHRSDKWYTELHSSSFVSGVTAYLFDKFNEGGFDISQFNMDCEDIEELRGWIWEVCDNRPIIKDSARSRMEIETEEIDQRIRTFADKYGLEISTD